MLQWELERTLFSRQESLLSLRAPRAPARS